MTTKRARHDNDEVDLLPPQKKPKICHLPHPLIDEILFIMFKYLPGKDLNTVRLVCNKWYQIQRQPLFIQMICAERQLLHDSHIILEKKQLHTKYYVYLGAKQGEAITFDPHTEQITRKWTMKNDKKHGFVTRYKKNGTPLQVDEYRHGKKHGNRKVYQNGILVSDADFEDDKLHGPCKKWNKHGAMLFDGGFFKGKKHGLVKEYTPKNQITLLETVMHFDRGTLHGTWESYHAEGWKMEQRNYDHGKAHGTCIKYYKNGDEWMRETYEQGVLVHTLQL